MKNQLAIAIALFVVVLGLASSASAKEETLGKIYIKAATVPVDGQQFADQGLEDSVSDLKKKAGKFVLAEAESEADFLIVVTGRETKVGQPSLLSHKTPRNVNNIHATISVRVNDGWKPGIRLSSNGCCKFWTDAAKKVMSEAGDWVEAQVK